MDTEAILPAFSFIVLSIPETSSLYMIKDIQCYVFPDANHSLEIRDMRMDLEYMKQIMQKTKECMKDRNKMESFGRMKGGM